MAAGEMQDRAPRHLYRAGTLCPDRLVVSGHDSSVKATPGYEEYEALRQYVDK
jgi:hypothetical protein